MNNHEANVRQLVQEIDVMEGNNKPTTHICSIRNPNTIEAKLSEKEFSIMLNKKFNPFNNFPNPTLSAITQCKVALPLSSTNENSNSQEKPTDLNNCMQNLTLNNAPF
jgi:hypothetical protein